VTQTLSLATVPRSKGKQIGMRESASYTDAQQTHRKYINGRSLDLCATIFGMPVTAAALIHSFTNA
jgi:hypothetical protein